MTVTSYASLKPLTHYKLRSFRDLGNLQLGSSSGPHRRCYQLPGRRLSVPTTRRAWQTYDYYYITLLNRLCHGCDFLILDTNNNGTRVELTVPSSGKRPSTRPWDSVVHDWDAQVLPNLRSPSCEWVLRWVDRHGGLNRGE